MKTNDHAPSSPPIRATQFLRAQRIDRKLALGKQATARSLAAELEVSERTCKRDIETLRDYFGAPIVWNAAARSYVYTEPFDLMARARLTPAEAVSLALASRTFAAWGDTQLACALEAALGKATDYLSDHATLPASDIAGLVSEPPGPHGEALGLEHFQPLLESIRARRAVRLHYRKPSDPKPTWRPVHPLHLALLDGRWVLVARDPMRRGIRKFVLHRIQKLEILNGVFEWPEEFDARAYLQGSFGSFAGDAEQEILIRIGRELAPYIRERKWHPSQRVEEREGGELIVRFTLTSLEDIRRWILGWGGQAEALEPPALRKAVAEELARARLLYQAKKARRTCS